jgi:undecaprenyl-diphosphatase
MSHLTFAEAMVVGLIQGVTELFPVSSLGHNVLIPALVGGSWAQDLNVSAPESPYLAFIVGLHVATAVAMIIYFWRDWMRIIGGFLTSVRDRRIVTADQRLAWLIVLATIPVGICGLALEHAFRVFFSKPIPTAIFLAANGVILLAGERMRRRTGEGGRTAASTSTASTSTAPTSTAPTAAAPAAGIPQAAMSRPAAVARPPWEQPVAERTRQGRGTYPTDPAETASSSARAEGREQTEGHEQTEPAVAADRRLAAIGVGRALLIGASQVLALLPGISRDGVVTVTGMFRGLSREDAVRFSFLLSAPVILAAGALKIPDLMGSLGNGIRGQILVGSVLSGVGAYLSVRFLVRYFAKSRSLTPFGIYCLVAGLGSLAYLALR